ncbi:efflux RND transporter permease subunit [Natronobacterium texcoconense]|uniref:Predicted exporter protein, RND superfamily n=1 Tax=Natronobacterium texcoconense TaxID=1095778 RepID=A0A1H1GE70_NATTX|nr:MMPL family transporter [Natronobacterium texcoconense]SDR11471.1 Predicted exporter protein, RND superfamily [Natronobacterium texcoconense]
MSDPDGSRDDRSRDRPAADGDGGSRFASLFGFLASRVPFGGEADGNDTDGTPSSDSSSRPAEDSDPFTRRVNPLITDRPWTIVLVFLLVTGVFMVGAMAGGGGQEAGTDQFTEDSDAQDAFDEMQDNFEQSDHSSGGTSAQLFVTDQNDGNVLSKPNLLRMLEFQDRVETEDGLRVTSTTSPASLVATQLDPEATTAEQQYREIDRASPRQLEAAIADADETAGIPVSTDFTRQSASADVAQIAVTYDTPPASDTSDNAHLQFRTQEIADEIDGFDTGDNVVIWGDALLDEEVVQLLGDTSIVVFPAAMILILFFLLVAYRDPIDLGLGLMALVMTLIWTFGFMGIAGIPFSDSLITVFPLLLAVGIDFGIHIINRYREERAEGKSIGDSMGITTGQLTTALLIVTLTTVFSFMANLVSDITQDFGIVAAAGIIFTFLIFSVFLPAGKVGLDRLREGTRFPEFGTSPLGQENSVMGNVLPVGVHIARTIPVIFLVVILVVGASAAAYGTGVDTEFDQEAFFPDEDRIEQYESLPGPLQPSEYTFMAVLDHLEEDFDQSLDGTVTIYVEDNDLRSDGALREIDRTLQNPPDAFATDGREADADTILGVIDSQAATDPEFAATRDRYDSNGDEIPDRNVDAVYDALFDSSAGDEAAGRLTTDRSATRIDVRIDVDAEQDEAVAAGRATADEMALDATATGQLVIFEAVIEQTLESSVNSLIVAFLLTMIFLVLSYWTLEGRAIYGVLNLVPVLLAVALLAGSMRYFDVPLTPINAPILSVSIGLGVDYTVHFMHRFVDEYENGNGVHESLLVTVRGTGGALTGSMLTTVTGLGVLYVALIPLIMEFGLLLALGVFYAWLTSIVVLPSVIVVWDQYERGALSIDGLRDDLTDAISSNR